MAIKKTIICPECEGRGTVLTRCSWIGGAGHHTTCSKCYGEKFIPLPPPPEFLSLPLGGMQAKRVQSLLQEEDATNEGGTVWIQTKRGLATVDKWGKVIWITR